MMIKIAEVGPALHPSEVVVAVKTLSGTETLVLDRRSIIEGTISVGHAIRRQGEDHLVELPRESQGGSSRVWINDSQIVEKERMTA